MFRRFYQAAVVLAGLTTLVGSCTRDLSVEPRRPSLSPQLVAPSNDAFGNATVIAALPFSDSVDITDATVETGERAPFCSSGASSQRTVWYAFTPTATGLLSITINAPFSTVVAVDTGVSPGVLGEVICRSPFGGISTFVAQAGTTYYFQVDGMFGQSGLLQFRLDAIVPPPNDNFVDATAIPALPFSNTVDLTAASFEAGEPTTPSCAAVWSADQQRVVPLHPYRDRIDLGERVRWWVLERGRRLHRVLGGEPDRGGLRRLRKQVDVPRRG